MDILRRITSRVLLEAANLLCVAAEWLSPAEDIDEDDDGFWPVGEIGDVRLTEYEGRPWVDTPEEYASEYAYDPEDQIPTGPKDYG